MLPGRVVASRFVRPNETEIVRENERLKRLASLRAAEHGSYVRRDQKVIARPCSIPRTRTRGSGDFEHVQGSAQRESVRRLEPERRTQNHHLRLFTPCERRTDRFDSRHLERSRKLSQKEKARSFEIPLRSSPRPYGKTR